MTPVDPAVLEGVFFSEGVSFVGYRRGNPVTPRPAAGDPVTLSTPSCRSPRRSRPSPRIPSRCPWQSTALDEEIVGVSSFYGFGSPKMALGKSMCVCVLVLLGFDLSG